MDRLQSYWAGEGVLHRAHDIPSWTAPKRSLGSLTYSTSSNRARVGVSLEWEPESGLVGPVNSSQNCPLGWPVTPAFLTFDPGFKKKEKNPL